MQHKLKESPKPPESIEAVTTEIFRHGERFRIQAKMCLGSEDYTNTLEQLRELAKLLTTKCNREILESRRMRITLEHFRTTKPNANA